MARTPKELPEQRCAGGCGTWLSESNRKSGQTKCFRCRQKDEDEAREREEREYLEQMARVKAKWVAKHEASATRKPRVVQPKPVLSPPPITDKAPASNTSVANDVSPPSPSSAPARPAADEEGAEFPGERLICVPYRVIRGK